MKVSLNSQIKASAKTAFIRFKQNEHVTATVITEFSPTRILFKLHFRFAVAGVNISSSEVFLEKVFGGFYCFFFIPMFNFADIRDGAGGGTRTHTVLLPTDFESVTSANSITPANMFKFCTYISLTHFLNGFKRENHIILKI